MEMAIPLHQHKKLQFGTPETHVSHFKSLKYMQQEMAIPIHEHKKLQFGTPETHASHFKSLKYMQHVEWWSVTRNFL